MTNNHRPVSNLPVWINPHEGHSPRRPNPHMLAIGLILTTQTSMSKSIKCHDMDSKQRNLISCSYLFWFMLITDKESYIYIYIEWEKENNVFCIMNVLEIKLTTSFKYFLQNNFYNFNHMLSNFLCLTRFLKMLKIITVLCFRW